MIFNGVPWSGSKPAMVDWPNYEDSVDTGGGVDPICAYLYVDYNDSPYNRGYSSGLVDIMNSVVGGFNSSSVILPDTTFTLTGLTVGQNYKLQILTDTFSWGPTEYVVYDIDGAFSSPVINQQQRLTTIDFTAEQTDVDINIDCYYSYHCFLISGMMLSTDGE